MNDDEPIHVRIDPLLAEIVPKFLDRTAQTVADLRKAVRSGDLAVARRVGHALHGTASSIGFEEMAEIGKEIERAARDGDSASLGRLADALHDHLSRVRPVFE